MVYDFQGTAAEVGWQHGETLRMEIIAEAQPSADALARRKGVSVEDALKRMAATYEPIFTAQVPAASDEIRGILFASGCFLIAWADGQAVCMQIAGGRRAVRGLSGAAPGHANSILLEPLRPLDMNRPASEAARRTARRCRFPGHLQRPRRGSALHLPASRAVKGFGDRHQFRGRSSGAIDAHRHRQSVRGRLRPLFRSPERLLVRSGGDPILKPIVSQDAQKGGPILLGRPNPSHATIAEGRRRRSPWYLRLAVPFLLTAAICPAQGTGVIYGTVTDSSGSLIPGATVEITHVATGRTRTLTTGTGVQYLFTPAPVGEYMIVVQCQGFKRAERRGLTVATDERTRVDFSLALGAVTESVTIEGAPPLVESSQASLSTLVDSERMKQLPLNGRDVLGLQFLVPGVVTGAGTASENAGLSVNGARGSSTNYTMDGGNAVDGHQNSAAAMPNPDAVQEFSVITFPLSAEYGRGGGGQVNVVTKSGTNELHASFFEFLRNERLNARSYFATEREILKRSQFGVAAGGPLIRSRTFLFGSWQKTILRQNSLRSIAYLPSDLERAGDFSQSAKKPVDPLNNSLPFPEHRIPTSRIDSASAAILDRFLMKSPTGDGFPTYRYNYPSPQNAPQLLAKIDHNFSERNRIMARWFQNDNYTKEVGGVPSIINENGFTTQSLTVSHTSVVKTNLVNVFQFTHTYVAELGSSTTNTGLDEFGVKIAAQEYAGKKWFGLSTPMFSISMLRPGNEKRRLNQLSDTATVSKGAHTMKFGIDHRHVAFDLEVGSNAGGSFTFRQEFSGVDVADYLLGLPAVFNQNSGQRQYGRGYELDLFFQDDFRLSRRVTLNLGMRWEGRPAWAEKNGNLAFYRAGQRSTVFENAPLGMLFTGDKGIPDGVFADDWNNFEPRIGFAWDIRGNGRTSLRGGYGIFLDAMQWGGMQGESSREPTTKAISINAPGSFKDPYGASGTTNPFPFDHASIDKSFKFTFPTAFDVFSDDFRMGYMQQWTLSAEQQIRGDSMVRLAYVGSKGAHLWNNRDINYATFVPGASTTSNVNNRRPLYQNGIAMLDYSESVGRSSYHSLQASYQRRYSKGVTVQANYTWAKSLDDISRGRAELSQPWPMNIRLNHGRSDWDTPHRAVGSFVWDLPWKGTPGGRFSRLLGGWQLTGIFTLQSGRPYTIYPGVATSYSGTGGERAGSVAGVSSDLSGSRSRSEKLLAWFNTAAFTTPAAGSWGNSGRNILSSPGTFNIDSGLMKNFRFLERHNIEFRAEAFGVLNNPAFGTPNNTLTARTFGQITSASGQRIMQLALKYSF